MMYAVRPTNGGPVYRVTTGYEYGLVNRSWQVIDTYASGIGYSPDKEGLPRADDSDWAIHTIHYKLDNLIKTQFKYTGEFTAEEKEHTEWSWEQMRNQSHFEWGRVFGGNSYSMESVVVIPGPFYVRACATFDKSVEYNEITLDFRSYLRKIELVA